MGVIEDRRRMIEAQPHLATASGTSLNVLITEPKIDRVRIHLDLQQSGSGTPSVDNVRTIVGWTDATISVDGTPVTVNPASLGGIVSGYYDTKSGIRWSDCTSQTLNGSAGLSSYSVRGDSSIFWGYCGNLSIYNTDSIVLSNMFTFNGYNYDYDGASDWQMGGASAYPNSLWFKIPTSVLSASSLDGVKAWAASHNIQIVSKRASGPTETNLGTNQISIARGQHTITSGAGDVDLDYWTN